MKKGSYRHRAFLFVFAIAFIAAPLASAQSRFDGTWRINYDESTPPDKPNTYLLQNGMFECSCVPPLHVKADGTDQPAPGHAGVDTVNVRELSPSSVTLTEKKSGKLVYDATLVVDDSNSLTVKAVEYPPNSPEPVTIQTTSTRVATAPAGANEISGAWHFSKRQDSENGLLITLRTNGDGLDMSDPIGESYSAKFDGKDYPVTGVEGNVTVLLQRSDESTIEFTFKRDGRAYLVRTVTVSADGSKMTGVSKNLQTGATSVSVLDKQ